MPEQSLTTYEGKDIAVFRDPNVVLEEAHKAAAALTSVISSKKKKVMFNGEQYLEFEDWQTVGRFYGITAKVKETKYVEYGGVRGFEATAVALRADGVEISQADAMCLNDEENWGMRPQYEWRDILDANGKKIWIDKGGKKFPKSEKVKIGEVAVPLYQLKSMAQTRACSKALRNVLAWVVVLAGYKPTPAEEMDSMAHSEEILPPKKQDKPESPSEPEIKYITEPQRKKIFAMLKDADEPPEDFKAFLKTVYKIESTKEIPSDKFEEICLEIENIKAKKKQMEEEVFEGEVMPDDKLGE